MKTFLPLMLAAALGTSGAEPLRVIVAGQTLMRYDMRSAAPDSDRLMRPLLSGADVLFTNLEAAVEGPGAEQPTRGPELLHAVDAAMLDAMQAEGFNLVALSDNHSWDLGTGGVLSTLQAVESRRLAHAGTGRDLAAAAAPGFLATPHGRVALVAMASGKVGTGGAAKANRPGVNELRLDEKTLQLNSDDTARILAAIRAAAAQAALVIVYEHNHDWADPMTVTPAWMEAWAHACVDAGAGLFVEHGEPLLHGIEIYRGRPIFYGLGNFVFQTRTQDKWKGPEIWESVIATLDFSGGRATSLRLRPIALNPQGEPGPRWLETRGWPRPAAGEQARTILRQVQALSSRYGTRWVDGGDTELAADLR